METAFVALGSNIDPERNILASLRRLLPEGLRKVSTVYRTEPVGPPGQPFFYNCVGEIATTRAPLELKYGVLRPIEASLGRRRDAEEKYAPRQADLDLIVYGGIEADSSEFVLPDPDIYTRSFLTIPLLELAPALVLPGGRRLSDLAASLDKKGMEELPAYTAMVRKELFG